MKRQHTTYLSLGSNLGDRVANLQKAIDKISESIGFVRSISSVYKTAAWGFDGAYFLNACIEVNTQLSPKDLLQQILTTEKELGRNRIESDTYQPRSIDIDILLFDQLSIATAELSIPHPRMLDRNFVLAPLEELASEAIHPVSQKTIAGCLRDSGDSSEIEKTALNLKRPQTTLSQFRYIAIEGNIGSGKTTLAHMISKEFNAKLVLERFADNPFLPKFYSDKERYAFPLEMSFLADRYSQLADDLAQFDLFKNFIVSDYYIFKSLIFAKITLAEDEYHLYRRMFDIMYKEIRKPDLYVYLHQSTDRLLENIKKRGRDYEKNIDANYLDRIQNGYANFIKTEQELESLIIDVSELDFVNNQQDYDYLLYQIESYSGAPLRNS